MENYYQAKSRLFKYGFSEKAIINTDDSWGKRLFEETEIEKISISTHDQKANWRIIDSCLADPSSSSKSVVELTIAGPGGILLSIATPLMGDYNSANVLMALALAVESGIDPLSAANALSKAKGAPGRMESIEIGQRFTAVIDYAHSPDAVSAALKAVRSSTEGRIIAVLGCGAGFDFHFGSLEHAGGKLTVVPRGCFRLALWAISHVLRRCVDVLPSNTFWPSCAINKCPVVVFGIQ
jgi:UDP-N-acetylmuramoyl-L-alanyl-D-glutamate--2,6-diaminopimelate ligase